MNKPAFLITIMLVFLFVNCNQSSVEVGGVIEADQELALKVEGMVCVVGCAKYIEKEVAKFSGVTNCKVNFDEETAQIAFSSEHMSQEEIVEAINMLSNGQYRATVVSQKSKSKNEETIPQENNEEKSDVTEVSFRFPELITYFISRLAQ